MSDRGAFDGESVFMERSYAEPTGVFVAWDSPLGCAVREPGEEAPIAPTAALDVEAIRTQAFAEGFEQGCKTVDAEVAAEREALAALTESLELLRPSPTDALAELLAATVERLVCQIVGEVAINPISLVKRAEAAARLIGEEVDASRLHVHPDDLALFARSRVPIEIVGNAEIARGALRLEWGRGWIEDGPSVRIERLRAALDQLGAK
jgi:flagellar assembly protein FliH